jgi:hypothetical protein
MTSQKYIYYNPGTQYEKRPKRKKWI